ncbi:hypothetical protein LCGC14_1992140, partial [marine sediment metagenome]
CEGHTEAEVRRRIEQKVQKTAKQQESPMLLSR